jgi:hypothetical protein
MSRPKAPQTSADVEREIRRLLEAKERLIADEDQRRGALLRDYLSRPNAAELRDALARFAGVRDRHLFGIDEAPTGPDSTRARTRNVNTRISEAVLA